MGLDVSPTKVVTLTDAHERRLITTVGLPPYSFPAGRGCVVYCLFRRAVDAESRDDGIPLMYALKRTRGHGIPIKDLKTLYRRSRSRLRLLPLGTGFDAIVPAPSTSNLPRLIAVRLGQVYNKPVYDVLRKQTVGNALRTASAVANVPKFEQRRFKRELGRLADIDPSLPIEVKSIHSTVRAFFSTVDILPTARIPHHLSLLVVDDSSSTGATVQDCTALLQRYFHPSKLYGLALMGP